MRSGCVVLAAACLALAAPTVRAGDFCSTCEVQLGLGGTYHWVGWSHGIVAPIIFTFDHDRWEFGAFRFTKGQDFYDSTFGVDIHVADPYWGFSFARRLELFPQRHWTFFAARTKPSRIVCRRPGGISTKKSACGSCRRRA
jgi:hypothetical protein